MSGGIRVLHRWDEWLQACSRDGGDAFQVQGDYLAVHAEYRQGPIDGIAATNPVLIDRATTAIQRIL